MHTRAIQPASSMMALSACAIHAYAQACSTSVGPDIIVGDMSGIVNFTPTAGVDALGLAHTLCNIGTVNIQCNPSPAVTHPILTQNLYRYSIVDGAGRFEQIGMGWVSHEFAMLSGTTCCTTCTPGSVAVLGPGCSSSTTASSSSTQSSATPRFEVNPVTASFPSTSSPPPVTSAVDRRLLYALIDVPPSSSGTRYFGEKIVLSPDDGTRSNNLSNRELTATAQASESTFALTSTVHRDQPAVLRWAEIEPSVHVSHMDIPGDGRVWLLSNATHLPTGLWRYEYLVFNQNSHRAIQSFQLEPVLWQGNNPLYFSNPGFHDVSYHSGDGPGYVDVSRTDWTLTGPGFWTTDSFATNQGANALRWGTAYNFRFDSAFPPSGTGRYATLGLWRPGTPATVTFEGVPTPATCNDIDVNNDGLFPDTLDIVAFLSMFAGGPCQPDDAVCDTIDFNNDTLFPDTLDLDALLSVFSGGPCL